MNRTSLKLAAAFGALIVLGTPLASFASDLVLWYQQPVGMTLAAPATGHPSQLALGMGGGKASPFMNEALPIGNGRLGGLITGDTVRERVVLNEDSLWTGDANPTGDYNTMGTYQTLGDLVIQLPGQEDYADYRRDLDLGNALAHVSYRSGEVNYRREFFCSHADGVLVARLTADRPGSYTGSIELKDSHDAQTVAG
jgi:hypothetical protein